MSKQYRRAVVIGRFQMVHLGHISLIQKALELADQVTVLVGSSFQSPKLSNPLSFDERVLLLKASFSKDQVARMSFEPIADHASDNDWIEEVQTTVSEYEEDNSQIILVGHMKPDTDHLNWFPQWGLSLVSTVHKISATELRNHYYETGEILEQYMAPACVKLLKDPRALLPKMESMRQEFEFIKNYQKKFESLPWAPIFVTVDSVVLCKGHILLVKRRNLPGKGLWALPGGFLEANESIVDSTVRELREETGLVLRKNHIKYTKVFDHPKRSQRGRTITHASLFVIEKQGALPKVKGGDDAERAKWFPLAEVFSMGEVMFEDHWRIITDLVRQC